MCVYLPHHPACPVIVFRVKLVALSRRPRSPSSAAQPPPPQMQVAQLPVELLIELLRPLTTNDLARVDQVSHIFHSAPQTAQSAAVGPQPATERPQSVVEQVLRRRAAAGGQAVPEVLMMVMMTAVSMMVAMFTMVMAVIRMMAKTRHRP